jgi:hypothetical protein
MAFFCGCELIAGIEDVEPLPQGPPPVEGGAGGTGGSGGGGTGGSGGGGAGGAGGEGGA